MRARAGRWDLPQVHAGMMVYGCDGSEAGRVSHVSRARRLFYAVDHRDRRLALPFGLIGLISDDFVLLRGTAAALRSYAVREAAQRTAPGVTTTPRVRLANLETPHAGRPA